MNVLIARAASQSPSSEKKKRIVSCWMKKSEKVFDNEKGFYKQNIALRWKLSAGTKRERSP